jgi:hypothetical protein
VLDASAPGALSAHGFDGLAYLYLYAHEQGYERLVVSFAYEAWAGPHDGSSWFEEGLDALRQQKRPTPHIVLAAGNARHRRVHLKVDNGRRAKWKWSVPPDNHVPSFMEIWAPDGVDDLMLQLTPPGGTPLAKMTWGEHNTWGSGSSAICCVSMSAKAHRDRRSSCAVVRIAPTRVADDGRTAAPCGDWVVQLDSAKHDLGGIDVYVGRAKEHMNSPKRGRQSFLRRLDGTPPTPGDKQGTLNALATHEHGETIGASHARNALYGPREAARYSGAGPSRGDRKAPNVAVVVEDGKHHPGILGIGNTSAAVVRMSGTSTAAPLYARVIHAGTQTRDRPAPVPAPGPPLTPELGQGILDPKR